MTSHEASDQWNELSPEAREVPAGEEQAQAAKRAQDAERARFATQPDMIVVEGGPVAPDYMPAPTPTDDRPYPRWGTIEGSEFE